MIIELGKVTVETKHQAPPPIVDNPLATGQNPP
jgi:hypothetical protein